MIITCRISTPDDWLDVNSGLYRLHADSFADKQTSWRRDDVTNPFVEGTWTVNALRENVDETLSVWVKTDGATSVEQAVETLTDALHQLHFLIEVSFDSSLYTYNCSVADTQVLASRELRFSGMANVVATIPRHPAYTLEVI